MDNQSCCCPSRAVARVIMPPTPERPNEVELLLCGHHLRGSQGTLAAAGAEIYVMPGELALLLSQDEQRLIYLVTTQEIIVIAARYHY